MSVTFWKISFLSIHSLLSVKTVDSLSTWILLFPGIWAAEIQISLWIQNSQISLATELHPIECASHRVNIVNSSGIVRLNAYVYRCHIKTEGFQTKEYSHEFETMWFFDSVSVHLPPVFSPPMSAPQPLLEASVYRVTSIFAFGVQIGYSAVSILLHHHCSSATLSCDNFIHA